MILVNGVPGRLVPCTGTFGARPADFPVGDDGSSPLANDLPSLTDRASAEWLWVLLTPLPGSGTTRANDLGGYALTGAADGTYTQDYRGLVLALDGSVTVYGAEITAIVGAASGFATANLGYSIRSAGALSAAIGYSVRSSGFATAALGYSIRSAGASSAAIGYSIGASAGTGSVVAGIGYGIRSAGASSAAIGYSIRDVGFTVAAAGYSIRAPGFDDLPIAYSIRASGSAEANVGYSIVATGFVVASIGYRIASAGGAADPADVWGYVLSNGKTAGQTQVEIHAMLTALLGGSYVLPVDVLKMNGAPVIGDGTVGNDWRGVGVQPQ